MNGIQWPVRSALIFIIASVLTIAASGEEQIILKQRTTKPVFIYGPISAIGQVSEEKDLMPGNDSFGFFYKPSGDSRGICRIRTKLSCDHGMRLLSELKNQRVLLIVQNKMLSQMTAHDGILDMLFRCPKKWQDLKVQLSAGKYETSFVMKDAPPAHLIPDKQCK